MQFFNSINGLAGRNDLVDMVLRLFYVTAVPLMATALAAILFLRPRRAGGSSPWRILAACALTIGFMAITTTLICAAGTKLMNAEIVTPRPFLTHWVNELIVEPNDDAFPCSEVMLVASMAVFMAAIEPMAGLGGLAYMLFFGFTRVFCGSNFPQDIVAGAGLGLAFGLLSLALCRVPLNWPLRDGRTFTLRPRSELAYSVGGLAAIVLITIASLAHTPRFAMKLHQFIHQAKAAADPATTTPVPKPVAQPLLPGAIGPEANMHEGEVAGRYVAKPAQVQDGHVPEAESALRADLASLNLAHKIISVEVAEVNTGAEVYRSDLVRFEVESSEPGERKRVAETAEAIFKRVFEIDGKAQNVDVIGVVVNGKKVSGPRLVFTPGIIPVFTASIVRTHLELPGAAAWTNAPGADAGAWLRARSLLYIDPLVLPGSDDDAKNVSITKGSAVSAPTSAPAPASTPAPTSSPRAAPSPSAAASPNAAARPTAQVHPTETASAAPSPSATKKN